MYIKFILKLLIICFLSIHFIFIPFALGYFIFESADKRTA